MTVLRNQFRALKESVEALSAGDSLDLPLASAAHVVAARLQGLCLLDDIGDPRKKRKKVVDLLQEERRRYDLPADVRDERFRADVELILGAVETEPVGA